MLRPRKQLYPARAVGGAGPSEKKGRQETDGGATGGILHWPDAHERYPDADVFVYGRVSSWGQAGKGKVKLYAQTDPVAAEVRKLAPGKLRCIGEYVEEGKMSKPRPGIRYQGRCAAERMARRGRPVIVVAIDLSRLIRSEEYDRRKNPEAWPTPEEFARLHKLTGGAILATLADPMMTEGERHSLATKRTKRCGRPRNPAFDHDLELLILEQLGPRTTGGRWDMSLTEVARRILKARPGKFVGQSEAAIRSKIQRLLDRPVNADLSDPLRGLEDGTPWKKLSDPARTYRYAMNRGLFKEAVPKP